LDDIERRESGILTFDEMVEDELARARSIYPTPQHNAHEGYAILLEEMDELWEEVKKRNVRTDGSGRRDGSAMLKELVQIGAMAQRMAEDIVLSGKHER